MGSFCSKCLLYWAQATDFKKKTLIKKTTTSNTNIGLKNKPKNNAVLIDKKIYSKLKSGRLNPERILDLHGLNYEKAYSEVIEFINTSYHHKKRLVLIITGKGRKESENDSFFSDNRRGVLRLSVPKWLESVNCKSLILNITTAHISHGGNGALYVYLKKNHKT